MELESFSDEGNSSHPDGKFAFLGVELLEEVVLEFLEIADPPEGYDLPWEDETLFMASESDLEVDFFSLFSEVWIQG